jgi:hypothetical protein
MSGSFNHSTSRVRHESNKKVGSVIDDPTNFFTAASLNSAGGFGSLLDSIGEALATGSHSSAVFF